MVGAAVAKDRPAPAAEAAGLEGGRDRQGRVQNHADLNGHPAVGNAPGAAGEGALPGLDMGQQALLEKVALQFKCGGLAHLVERAVPEPPDVVQAYPCSTVLVFLLLHEDTA